MSDSVDRVFSHALNTVNKIRTGVEKPPAALRLKLYGLYKQSMEGDVEGIMTRPSGADDNAQRAREKWDAWKSCDGLSRTEAKRRYVTTLIETMRKYAANSPDTRELVDELEFVWDQVKSNVPSSNSSSPGRPVAQGLGMSSVLGGSGSEPPPPFLNRLQTKAGAAENKRLSDLKILSPLSQSQEDDDDDDPNDDEFVDAQDSQIAEPPPNLSSDSPNAGITGDSASHPPKRRKGSADDARWRRRVESALVKMTAEVAALREQLEARRLWSLSRRGRLLHWGWSLLTAVVKHVAIDAFFLILLLLWLRRKEDGRLEGAVRVLLGDAVAQAQRVGTGVQKKVGRALGAARLSS